MDVLAVIALLQPLETVAAQEFQAHPPKQQLGEFLSRIKGEGVNPGHFLVAEIIPV